jgi:hypothetical protein
MCSSGCLFVKVKWSGGAKMGKKKEERKTENGGGNQGRMDRYMFKEKILNLCMRSFWGLLGLIAKQFPSTVPLAVILVSFQFLSFCALRVKSCNLCQIMELTSNHGIYVLCLI